MPTDCDTAGRREIVNVIFLRHFPHLKNVDDLTPNIKRLEVLSKKMFTHPEWFEAREIEDIRVIARKLGEEGWY